MNRALVTGGAGFIGSHLVLKLQSLQVETIVLDDMSNGLESNLNLFRKGIVIQRDSILDLELLKKITKGVDVIFHLAAVSNVAQTLSQAVYAHDVNATGTLNVLEAARENGCHVVISSSAATYGNCKDVPIQEDSPQIPISLYGSQKLLNEHYLKNYCHLFGLSGAALRYFNVFGPRQRPDSPYSGVISIFCDRAKQNLPIIVHGSGNQTRDFVFVADVVDANIAAAQQKQLNGDAFNVCTSQPTSIMELAHLVKEITKSASLIENSEPRSGDILHSLGNNQKARNVLSFMPQVEFKRGLELLTNGASLP